MIAFYGGERLLGGHADALRGRKPAHVVTDVFEVLGESPSQPSVAWYLSDPSTLVDIEANSRGGVDFIFPAGSLNASDDVPPRFSAEELAAMYLLHAKEFSERHTGSSVRDGVLTIPMFASQGDRLALLDAAALADLNVLGLVEENTAAAIHYGIDRVTENGTHTLMLYNMGVASTQVSIFEYDAYTEKQSGKNKSVGQARAIGKAYDTSLGSRSFDNALINYVVDAFNADKKVASKLPAEAAGDLRNYKLGMVKVAKACGKAKEILSANDAYVVTLEGVLTDVDFRVPVTRQIFEEAVAKAGLWARVTAVLDSALAQAGIDTTVVDTVQLIGGGVRTPKVASMIREHVAALYATTVKGLDAAATVPQAPIVGTHMNGDESQALGAAFLAANRSSAFRVRKVGMVEGFPFPIGVRIAHLAPATTDGKPWTKRASLFSAYNALDSVKKTSFNSSTDLRLTLQYENTTSGLQLPDGTPRTLGFFNITGIDKLMSDPAYVAHGVPKIHISFLLDENGIASVSKAEAWQERDELVPVPPEPKKKAAVVNATATNATAANATAVNATASANATEANTADANSTQAEGAESSNSTAAANATAPNDDVALSNETDANTTAAPKMQLVKRLHKVTLVVTSETANALAVQPLTAADKSVIRLRLKKLKDADNAKRELEGAKNALEEYILAVRSRINDDDEIKLVANATHIEELPALLTADEEWLEGEEGSAATLAQYREHLAVLKGIFEPIFYRLEELRERPGQLEVARKAVEEWGSIVAAFNKTHPQVRRTLCCEPHSRLPFAF